MGRAAWRSQQEPAGKEGQLPTAIWAEGGAGGGVVPARGVGLPFNSLISNFLQLRRRRRGRRPRAGKVPEKAGNISTLPQAAGPLSSLRSVVSKRAWVPGMPPSPSRAERSPGAHLPVARLSPLPEGSSALRGHTCNPAPTSGLSPHLHHLPSAQGTPRASGAGIEAPILPLPGPGALRGPRKSGPVVLRPHPTGPRDARPASLSKRLRTRTSTRGPRGQTLRSQGPRWRCRPSDRSREGGQDALPEDPSPRRGAASRAGALTCGETCFCQPGAAAAAASSRRGGLRPATSSDSASPGGPPRSERGHADCWGPGPARALLPRPPASRLRRHLKRQSPISRRRLGSRAPAAGGPFNARSR